MKTSSSNQALALQTKQVTDYFHAVLDQWKAIRKQYQRELTEDELLDLVLDIAYRPKWRHNGCDDALGSTVLLRPEWVVCLLQSAEQHNLSVEWKRLWSCLDSKTRTDPTRPGGSGNSKAEAD